MGCASEHEPVRRRGTPPFHLGKVLLEDVLQLVQKHEHRRGVDVLPGHGQQVQVAVRHKDEADALVHQHRAGLVRLLLRLIQLADKAVHGFERDVAPAAALMKKFEGCASN